MSYRARWVFDLTQWKPTLPEISLALSSVQVEELARINKFVYLRDASASLIGRLLARSYCCKAADIKWDQIILSRGADNKPFLRNNPSVKFNVSHQGRYVVLCGETNVDYLGIDVMKQDYTGGKVLSEFFRLMHRNFAPSEWSFINASNDDSKKIKNFFRLWTLKESYVKAIGVGITVPLDEIEFKPKNDLSFSCTVNNTELFLRNIRQDWTFEEYQIDSDHCMSVAVSSDGYIPKDCFEFVSFDDIKNLMECINNEGSGISESLLSKPYSP